MPLVDSPLKRIRVKTHGDIERLYPLILDLCEHPEQTAGVTEFIFKCPMKGHRHIGETILPDEWKAREAAREPPAGSPLWKAVKRIGLESNEEKEWTKALTWMDPGTIAERETALDALGDPWMFQPMLANQDTVFAQYAAALLLTLCPNIETLAYEDNDCDTPVTSILKRNNYGSLASSYLSKLRTVNLLPTSRASISDPRYYNDLDVLGLMHLYHRLPFLESISADAIMPNGHAGYSDRFPPESSAIKKIHMTHVSFPSSVIAALIRMPRTLEQFTCTSGGRATIDGSFYLITPATLGRALWCQRHNLRQLELDLDQYISRSTAEEESEDSEDDESEDEEEYGNLGTEAAGDVIKTRDLDTGRAYNLTVGSLHDFYQLTRLKIGVRLLLGPEGDDRGAPFRLIEALPRSLKHLSILGYTRGQDAKHDEQLDELLALRVERLPNLQTLEGFAELLPRGEDVDNPDDDAAQLWEPEAVEDHWQVW